MAPTTKRCTPRVLSLSVFLSLVVIVVYLDSKLAWNYLPSFKHAVRSVEQRSDSQPKSNEQQLVQTLHAIAQNTSVPRGIVIPVYEPIVHLAVSLILELRTMGIEEPIEMPHCGDVTSASQQLFQQKSALGSIRFYDVCDLAAGTTTVHGNSTRNVFCEDLEACHTKFRSFDIKVISVVFSKFDEIMMIDADTAFFVSPAMLWESTKYKTTGTLLMNDRIAHEIYFMAERVGGDPNISYQHRYMSRFDPAPFRSLPTLERPKAILPNPAPVTLKFEPSDFLLNSHSWNLRTGHQVDSSLMFWNKKKQPRATAILASFKTLTKIGSPPSYGDKELYFYAAELAETQYAFSDHAIGAVGTEYHDYGEKNSTLCGDMAQVFPIKQATEDDVPLFYLNSDRVLYFRPEVEPVYYMKARMADVYPGAFGERRMECPFDITGAMFSPSEAQRLTGRQRLHKLTMEWERVTHGSEGDPDTRKNLDRAADVMVDELMHEMRDQYRQVVLPNV